MAVEEEFAVVIPDAEADKINSCSQAIEYIAAHPSAKQAQLFLSPTILDRNVQKVNHMLQLDSLTMNAVAEVWMGISLFL